MRRLTCLMLLLAELAPASFAAFKPSLPVYSETALSPALRTEIWRETPTRLATLKARMGAQWRRVKAEIPTNAFQYVRTEKRMEIAGRLFGFAQKELARGDTDGLAFAFLATEDLRRFCDLFDDELRYWKTYPLAPGVRPKVIRVADYGATGDGKSDNIPAFDAAVAEAAASAGAPVVIEVPEGEFHFKATEERFHVELRNLTNVVLRGVSPEKTRLRFDNMDQGGVLVWGGANVTVADLEVASTETPFFQGVVESFDKADGRAIVRRHPGTMRPDDPRFLRGDRFQFCLGIFDAKGNEVVDSWLSMFYDRRAEDLGDGRFNVAFIRDHYNYKRPRTRLEPGWQIVIPLRKGFCANVETARGAYLCNVVNVWIRNGRGSAVGFCSEAAYSSAWRVRVFPFSGLLAASGADAIMNHRGTFIGESSFDHLNDDGGNCYSLGRRIQRIENGDTAVSAWLPCGYTVGDPMQIMSAQTGQFLYLGRVKRAGGALSPRGVPHDMQFEDVLPSGIRTIESIAQPQPTGEERFLQAVANGKIDGSREADGLYRPYMFGVGHVVYRTRFSSLRGSGAVCACPNALFEDVTYEYMNRGISLSSLGNLEGPAPYNVWIRNCTFRHCLVGIEGRCIRGVGGKFLTAPIRGLKVEGCRFEDVGTPYIDDNVGDDAVVQSDLLLDAKDI